MELEERLKEMQKNATGIDAGTEIEKSKEAPKHQLDFWPDEVRALPNHLARTSLFAPIQRGRRKMHDDTKLNSPEGVTVLFTGKQLDMADQDVFMQALHLARDLTLGERVYFKRAEFLRAIGRNERGKASNMWLHESFQRLTKATILVESKRYKIGVHLVDAFEMDDEAGEYYLSINPKIRALFSNKEYGFVDLTKRLQIEQKRDLSKWLQSYAASHSPGVHKVQVDLLREWCGWSGRARNFRDALHMALVELVRVQILADAEIGEDSKGRLQARWNRLNSCG